MRASTSTALLLSIALALPLGGAGAQLVLGPGPDASTLPKGAFRTTISGDQAIDRGRFNNGESETLGAAFSVSSFGASQHSALAALTSAFGAMGVGGLAPSLGATTLTLRQRIQTTRLGVEVGVFDWLTVSVDVPFVRSRAEGLLRLNGDGGAATAGLNPLHLGTAVGTANGATILSYQNASSALLSRRADCEANAGAHAECGIILAEATSVSALSAMTSNFATRLGLAYGGAGYGNGLPFVPMSGSAGEVALATRADSMRLAFERYGVAAIDSTAMLPLGAQTPLTASDLALMVGAGFVNGGGYGARSMTKATFQQIGDVDLSARIRVFDRLSDTAASIAMRQTFGLTYRLGSGYPDRPDDFIDAGSGSVGDGIAVRSFTDLRLRNRLFATLTLGWMREGAHDRVLRVPWSSQGAWIEDFTTQVVGVTPGSIVEVGIAPRWQLSEQLLIGAEWRHRAKAADDLEYSVFTLPSYGEVFLAQAGGLQSARAWNDTRLSWSMSYSTLSDVAAGRGRLPIEIGYTHEQTVSSSLGVVPQRFTDRIQIRYYTRFFGR